MSDASAALWAGVQEIHNSRFSGSVSTANILAEESVISAEPSVTATSVKNNTIPAVSFACPDAELPYAAPNMSINGDSVSSVFAGKEHSSYSLDKAQRLDVTAFPDPPQGRYNELPATIPNILHMLNGYGIEVRYNLIKKALETILPGISGATDNASSTALTQIISLTNLNGIPVGQIPSYIEALGDRSSYNPVADWIQSKPWDGRDRLLDVYKTLTVREGFPETLKNILIYKWLLSAVAAALMDKGFKARGVLTFQGPQGIGKTSWVTSLVPNEILREAVVKVDHHLDPSNKDSILGAITHWIVEIGELDSSFKKDVARLKGFLTSGSDKVRRPYGRSESEYQRRTVFFATVNDNNFLVDSTGNSRWWTIPLTAINYRHTIDMQQVFAQLAIDLGSGGEWWLSKSEEMSLEDHNREHRSVSVIRELLMELIDPDLDKNDRGNPPMTAMELLKELGFEHPTNPQCRECGAILRELYGEPKKSKGQSRWRIPLKRQSMQLVAKTLAGRNVDDDDRY